MSKYISVCVLLGMPFLVTSCFPTQKLPKRYKSYATRNYVPAKDSIKYFVGVSGYAHGGGGSEKVKVEQGKNIFSLSGEGQKQLIESIADNEKTSEELLAKLSEDIIPGTREVKLRDMTRFNRKLSFSVDNLRMNPADRIMKVTISIAPSTGSEIKILSCNKLTADNKSVVLSSGITAGALNLLEESKGNNDLVGSLSADVAFEYKGATSTKEVYVFNGLYNRDKTTVKPNDVDISQQRCVYPDLAKDELFSCSYEAVVRHVIEGDNTISEADDEIEVVKGKATTSDISIITKGQLTPKLWMITDSRNNLELNGPTGQNVLLFATYEDALNFITWFKRSSSEILVNSKMGNGAYQAELSGGATLTDSFIKNCVVKSL